MNEDREELARKAAADVTKKDHPEKKNTDDMREYKKEYPDFSEALKGRKITLREC